MGAMSQKSLKNIPELPAVQVFEFYFYPEYAYKTDKIKEDDPNNIQFYGLRDTLEKCSNMDGASQMDEMRSQADSFVQYMDKALEDVKFEEDFDDEINI